MIDPTDKDMKILQFCITKYYFWPIQISMGQNVSMYPKFHFIVIPSLPATVYYEVTASNLVTHNMNEVVAHILGTVPGELKKECFQTSEFTNADAFKLYSFLILDERYSFVAFATYSREIINEEPHYVVWNVCTAEKYRGQKIIGKVLLFSIEYLKSLNDPDIKYISLYVLKDAISAQKIYEKLGFSRDFSFENDSLFRGTRPLNWIPSEIRPEAQQSLSSTEMYILQIEPINADRESSLLSKFRRDYLKAARRFINPQTTDELAKRDRTFAEIRAKYRNISVSIMDEIISGITLSEQLSESENEVKVTGLNLDEWAETNSEEEKRRARLESEFEEKKKAVKRTRVSSIKIQDQFHDEYYDALEKLYDALTDLHVDLDEYSKLKNTVENIEEKYMAQISADDIKTTVNQVIEEINDNPRYSEDWGQINRNRIVFEQELMNIERENIGEKQLDASLIATTQAHAIMTTFNGTFERQLVGMAYLAGKHRDKCCVYHPDKNKFLDSFSALKASMVLIVCDAQGNQTLSIPDDLKQQITSCNKHFFFILLGIIDQRINQGHQNLLIYDVETKIIERFEPNGRAFYNTNKSSCFDSERIDNLIQKWLEEMDEHIIYVPPLDYCPAEPVFQSKEAQEEQALPADPIGFCVAWSLWYADVRLANPKSSRADIIKRGSEFLKTRGQLRSFIRNYANYIERILAAIQTIINLSTPVPIEEWILGHWYELYQLAKP